MVLPVLTLWLADEIARGLVARHFGLTTPSFGVRLGLERPRFHIQVVSGSMLPRRTSRLWLSGLPILLRFFLFGTSRDRVDHDPPLGIVSGNSCCLNCC